MMMSGRRNQRGCDADRSNHRTQSAGQCCLDRLTLVSSRTLRVTGREQSGESGKGCEWRTGRRRSLERRAEAERREDIPVM